MDIFITAHLIALGLFFYLMAWGMLCCKLGTGYWMPR